jgi:hypothetical protein
VQALKETKELQDLLIQDPMEDKDLNQHKV